MNHPNHVSRRLSGASLFAAALLTSILLQASTASAAAYRHREVHRSGPYRDVHRSRTVARGGPAYYGGSVRYSSRTVARGGVVAPGYRSVSRTRVRVGHVVPVLPRGCTTVRVRGVTHYRYGGVYYRPYYQGTKVVYKVVDI